MRIVIGLLCLFFLVIFHEFGHFIAAKLCKVKVESFSFGFGPILFHKKIKGTDFRLSLVPLGGYCGMKGEKDFSEALKNGSKEIVADNDSLYGTHPLKRIIIAFAFKKGSVYRSIWTGSYHRLIFNCWTVITAETLYT